MPFYKFKQWINGYIQEPVDIYEAHKYLFYLSQIFGLVSYKLYKNNGIVEYRSNYILMVINIILVIIFLAAFVFLAYKVKPVLEKLSDYNIIEVYANCFQYFLSTIEIITSAIVTKKIIRVFKNIVEIDKSFRDINIWISYK